MDNKVIHLHILTNHPHKTQAKKHNLHLKVRIMNLAVCGIGKSPYEPLVTAIAVNDVRRSARRYPVSNLDGIRHHPS
ncbi:MAG: hypothetical protein LUF35_05310 [Lachnospiraceae bacterium]|nr:hypothetical protein [Lachnospiraceae bacterium]